MNPVTEPSPFSMLQSHAVAVNTAFPFYWLFCFSLVVYFFFFKDTSTTK